MVLEIGLNIKKNILKKWPSVWIVYQGIQDGQKLVTLNSWGNTLKALKTVGCRGLKRHKKSVIYYTLKCFKGY